MLFSNNLQKDQGDYLDFIVNPETGTCRPWVELTHILTNTFVCKHTYVGLSAKVKLGPYGRKDKPHLYMSHHTDIPLTSRIWNKKSGQNLKAVILFQRVTRTFIKSHEGTCTHIHVGQLIFFLFIRMDCENTIMWNLFY